MGLLRKLSLVLLNGTTKVNHSSFSHRLLILLLTIELTQQGSACLCVALLYVTCVNGGFSPNEHNVFCSPKLGSLNPDGGHMATQLCSPNLPSVTYNYFPSEPSII